MKIDLLDSESEWFVKEPSPLAPAKYATIGVLRRTLDYAAFRTEADKYTNSVATPAGRKTHDVIERALILASKQKAVERRQQNKLVRDLYPDNECYLKDYLCLECPVCALNGGIKAVKGAGDVSIKSRILYQTAFSVLPFDQVVESITFNAVDERTTKTDQALGERELVKPDTYFVSTVSILSPTVDELKFYLYSLFNTTRYGAETRGIGVIENKLLGVVLSDTEEFSALGVTMDFYDNLIAEKENPQMNFVSALDVFHDVCVESVSGNGQRIYKKDEVVQIEKDIRSAEITKSWLQGMFKTSKKFKDVIAADAKK